MPKWLDNLGNEPTRKKSDKQETRLAKEFGGRKTSNSGAKFTENDVTSKSFDIEAKTTKSSQYIMKMSEIEQMERRADKDKIPIFVVEFNQHGREFVIMDKQDFLTLSGTKDLINKP